MVDGSGLENRHTRKGIGGSNPSLSASLRVPSSPLRISAGGSDAAKTPQLETRNRKLETIPMFARKIRVQYQESGKLHSCPVKWLDSFSMRNFTNDQVFDDTIPMGDGRMEIGARVPLERLRDAMEDWFRRKSYLPPAAVLVVKEE